MSEGSDLLRTVLKTALKQGMSGARIVGQQSKRQMEIRGLKQKRNTLYKKLGKEVEQLVIQGELEHPGIERALQHLKELEDQLAAYGPEGTSDSEGES